VIVPLRAVPGTSVFHVTVLSNFARGYDKYRRQYRKQGIPESTYPNEFYVLKQAELAIGVAKASKLLAKLSLPGDALIALEARMPDSALSQSPSGLGLVWASPDLPIERVHRLASGTLEETTPEELTAGSLAIHAATFGSYASLRPRAVSFLPVAKGCQAACPFCFSDGSVSVDQAQARLDWTSVDAWLALARSRGAERAVITGGDEPTMLDWSDTTELVRRCSSAFGTTVLITNGFKMASASDPSKCVRNLREAGLSVLAISRHHADDDMNARLMKLDTRTVELLNGCRQARASGEGLRIRLVCVLQRGGVESVSDVEGYIRWAASVGADEVCFKELYVSSSLESVYYSRPSNTWSARHQVSLEVVTEWASQNDLSARSTLPWGSPIYEAPIGGRVVRVAAYTEPSLFWERTHGLARSWNVMSDGTCLASLEDRRSVINVRDVEASA
jgi:molybdenum cofactor biosynthesis enzyme MoaA